MSPAMFAVDLRWDDHRRAVSFTAVQHGAEYPCRVSVDALAHFGATHQDAAGAIAIFHAHEGAILEAVKRKLIDDEVIQIRRDDLS